MHVESAPLQELREEHVARLRPSGFVEPAREDAERILVDQAELLVEHHEDAVDVDVPEGQRDLEEILHVLPEDDLAQRAGALLVGPVAERGDRGVFADEGDTAPLQESGRLDRAEDGNAEAPEGARHHLRIAASALEVRAHQHGASREHRREITRVGHVGTVVDVVQRVIVARQHLPQQQDLDALRVAVHRPREVELLQGLRGDHVQFGAGAVHEDTLQAPVGAAHVGLGHGRGLLIAR